MDISMEKDPTVLEELVIIDEVQDEEADLEAIKENANSTSNGIEEVLSWEIDDEPVLEEEVESAENGNEGKPLKEVSKVSIKVPRYGSLFTGFLTEKEYSIDTGKHVRNDCVRKKTCFNCLGDHNIQDCKKSKNYEAIQRNKRNILGKRTSNVRYHEVMENKNVKATPGVLSDTLLEALGVIPGDAPEFTYRMRILGYPPGWLRQAEAQRADLSLFDGTGKALSHPDDEEGETDAPQVRYHPDKLVCFPGFNVPFPDDIFDNHTSYGFPPMQEIHSKEAFLTVMTENRASRYKRKKLKASDTPQSERTTTGGRTKEMDMDDESESVNAAIEFNPPLPDEESRPPEPPSSPATGKDLEDGELSGEAVKIPKPAAVQRTTSQDSAVSLAPGSPSTPKLGSTIDLDSTVDLNSSSQSPIPSTPSNCESPSPSVGVKRSHPSDDFDASDTSLCASPAPNTPTPGSVDRPLSRKVKRQHRSTSKGFKLGVSIPDSITPFKTLPDAQKWTVDVSDHINFDNLPDALGTWKKMQSIMTNVKGTMTELHADDE